MADVTLDDQHPLTPQEIAVKLVAQGMKQVEARSRGEQLFRATLGHRAAVEAYCDARVSTLVSEPESQTIDDFILRWWRQGVEITRLVESFSRTLELERNDALESLTALLTAPVLNVELCEQLRKPGLFPGPRPEKVLSAIVELGLTIEDAAGQRLPLPSLHRMAGAVCGPVLGAQADQVRTALAIFCENTGDLDAAFAFRCQAGDFSWLERRLEEDPGLCVNTGAIAAAQILHSRDLASIRESPLVLALLTLASLAGAATPAHALQRIANLREQHTDPIPIENTAQLASLALVDSLLGTKKDLAPGIQERHAKLLIALRSGKIRSDKQAAFAALAVAHSAILDSEFAVASNAAELGRLRTRNGSTSAIRRALTAMSAYATIRLGEVHRAERIMEVGLGEGHTAPALDYWSGFSHLTAVLVATERNAAQDALEWVDVVAPSLGESPAWPHLLHARIRIARRFTALVPDQILASTELINAGWQCQAVLARQWQVAEPLDDETSHDYSYRQLMQPGILPPKTAAQFTLDVATSMLIARFLKYAHRAIIRNGTANQNARELARGWHALHTSKHETALRCANRVERDSLVTPYHRIEAFALEAAGYWEVGDTLRAHVAFRGALGLIKTLGPHATAFSLVPHETLLSLRASFVDAADTSESLVASFDGLEIAGLENFWRKTVQLTRREQETLTLAAAGNTTQEIGDHMFISYNTAKRHLSTIYQKLGVTSRQDAINIGLEYGFIAHDR